MPSSSAPPREPPKVSTCAFANPMSQTPHWSSGVLSRVGNQGSSYFSVFLPWVFITGSTGFLRKCSSLVQFVFSLKRIRVFVPMSRIGNGDQHLSQGSFRSKGSPSVKPAAPQISQLGQRLAISYMHLFPLLKA